ncbi:hypothetical protein DICPUDRAFT_146552 [Dictyostelium purpureum]|uniref:Uncharacterized protein n=1 Tax=Dictyostelium purpureum TaxID=5786 RepID=F0Z694_DICPU|nr:uncharacterized protein DICPUDRAFT_146552 [Dictyostelium purpureum]EGC40561.1 hypothetical protein DICPUDRAFT_146552 [Dictyostelium purpureum]|eukprot:XP_003282897.1 hypothetical protein DICPUDRAFT_146552 [Dictyostelium purpureum]
MNNNSNNNNDCNDKLFFSIWRNKFLLCEIQRHHGLYKIKKIILVNKSMDQL